MSSRNVRRILQKLEEPLPPLVNSESDTDEDSQDIKLNANAYQELAAALESDHGEDETRSESQSESESEPEPKLESESEAESGPEPEFVHKTSRRSRRRANKRLRKAVEVGEPVASTSKENHETSEDFIREELSQDTSTFTPDTNSLEPDSDSFTDYSGNLQNINLSDCDISSETESLNIQISEGSGSIGSGASVRNTSVDDSDRSTPTSMTTTSIDDADSVEYKEIAEMLSFIKSNVVRVSSEMRRLFGTDDLVELPNIKPTLRERLLRKAILVEFPEYLLHPHYNGLSMSLHRNPDGTQFYTFDHSPEHQKMHRIFLDSFNDDATIINLENILRHRHIESLLQTFDTMCRKDDVSSAHSLLQHIIAMLQYAAMPSFNVSDRNTRLPYKYVENRPYFIALLKYVYLLSNKACHRTALEMCKMMLNLDPTDPLALLLIMDTLALRAREFDWLVNALDFWAMDKQADFMFNMVYSHALAFYHCVRKSQDPVGHSLAHELLRNAILRFPYVVCAIIKHMSSPAVRELMDTVLYREFAPRSINPSIAKLVNIYAKLTWPRWNEPTVVNWFLNNARLMATYYVENEEIRASFHSFGSHQSLLFVGLPAQVLRHMCIIEPISNWVVGGTDIPVVNGYTSFDPIPPVDGIDRYGYNRRASSPSPRPTNWYAFFSSMLPFRDPGL